MNKHRIPADMAAVASLMVGCATPPASGPLPEAWAISWNFSHGAAGCIQETLVRTGGAGRFCCFAAN